MAAVADTLRIDLIRLLVCNGSDIYTEDASGKAPLHLVRDPRTKTEMVFQVRKPLLLFLEAVCVTEELTNSHSLRRVAESSDMVRHVVMFA